MFHCSDLNDSLKDTRNKSKPAYFLSASRIALIASCLENNVLQDPGCQNRIIEVGPLASQLRFEISNSFDTLNPIKAMVSGKPVFKDNTPEVPHPHYRI